MGKTGPRTQEVKDKLSKALLGRKNGPHSSITKEKIRNALFGRKQPNISKGLTGRKLSEETKAKIKSYNPEKNWKDLCYRSKHKKIVFRYGKANKCEGKNCTKKCKKFEWSNISRTYLEDRSDWQMLCSSCHTKFDKGLI